MGIKIKKWGVYLVNLNPKIGTKPGKLRPCVVIQDDALNEVDHPSTVILPISSKNVSQNDYPLRVFLPKGEGGLEKDSVALVDQIIAWDSLRFVEYYGSLSDTKQQEIEMACREFFGWN